MACWTNSSTSNHLLRGLIRFFFQHHTSYKEQKWVTTVFENLRLKYEPESFRKSSATRPPSYGPTQLLKSQKQVARPGWRTGRCPCWFLHHNSQWCSAPPSHSGQRSSRDGQMAARSCRETNSISHQDLPQHEVYMHHVLMDRCMGCFARHVRISLISL